MTTKTHGESLYIWSGVQCGIIDAIHQAPSGIRCIRNCDNVVAPDEVEDVEFISWVGDKKKRLI